MTPCHPPQFWQAVSEFDFYAWRIPNSCQYNFTNSLAQHGWNVLYQSFGYLVCFGDYSAILFKNRAWWQCTLLSTYFLNLLPYLLHLCSRVDGIYKNIPGSPFSLIFFFHARIYRILLYTLLLFFLRALSVLAFSLLALWHSAIHHGIGGLINITNLPWYCSVCCSHYPVSYILCQFVYIVNIHLSPYSSKNL